MSRARALIAALAAVPLVAAVATPAFAGGPIYAYLRDLPPPIAKLHTCIRPRQRTLFYEDTWRVGKQFVFRVGCPENAPNITVMPGPYDFGRARQPDDDPDHYQSTVYYLADDARGRNARRLVLPVPRADGTTLMVDAFVEEVSPGWSAREDTSMASGLAYFDIAGRRKYPPGEFMVMTVIPPAGRPEVKGAFGIWRVTNGKAALIYHAETTETLPKDAPVHARPRYTIVLDQRPEN